MCAVEQTQHQPLFIYHAAFLLVMLTICSAEESMLVSVCGRRVLNGVMFQKDVVAPGRMRRKIHKPRILLLDCPLEYKKGENQTNVEIEKEEDW